MFENSILLASDLTATSRSAEAAAFELATRLKVKLIILHVIPERSSLGMSTIPPEMQDIDELNRKLQAVGAHEVPGATRLLKSGSPEEAILGVMADYSVDLVVLGTQGRKGISRAVLGSVAEAVLRQSAPARADW